MKKITKFQFKEQLRMLKKGGTMKEPVQPEGKSKSSKKEKEKQVPKAKDGMSVDPGKNLQEQMQRKALERYNREAARRGAPTYQTVDELNRSSDERAKKIYTQYVTILMNDPSAREKAGIIPMPDSSSQFDEVPDEQIGKGLMMSDYMNASPEQRANMEEYQSYGQFGYASQGDMDQAEAIKSRDAAKASQNQYRQLLRKLGYDDGQVQEIMMDVTSGKFTRTTNPAAIRAVYGQPNNRAVGGEMMTNQGDMMGLNRAQMVDQLTGAMQQRRLGGRIINEIMYDIAGKDAKWIEYHMDDLIGKAEKLAIEENMSKLRL